MTKNLPKGFTLIELLIVIAIIATMAGITLFTFSGSQKKGRDGARKSDIKQYQNALEIFANKNNGFYPSRVSLTGDDAATTLCTDLAINGCSAAPLSGNDSTYAYLYQSDGTGAGAVIATKYVVWGKLEYTLDNWVVCSNGKTGSAPQSGFTVSGGNCPI